MMAVNPIFFLLASILVLSTVSTQTYMDPSQPIAERVADLLKQMTVDEKIAQLFHSSSDYSHQYNAKTGTGWLSIPGSTPEDIITSRNKEQQFFINSSRLHIPVGFTQESLHSSAKGGTVFPMPVTQGCSWNVTTVNQIAEAVGLEASIVGVTVGYSPVLNMITDPRFGRLSEGFSEEPTLSSAYARAAVAGLQGDNGGRPLTYLDNKHILSLAKHYAAYGSEAGGLNAAPAQISERTLREIYLKPWKAFAQSGGRGVMVSHETINHIPCHSNSWLINDILRDEFNFSHGIAISDCNDIGVLVQYKVAENYSQAAAKALRAGLDIDLMCGGSPDKWSFNNLHAALAVGLVTEEDIDTACSRVLAAKFASRLFDEPMVDPSRVSTLNNTEHRKLAYDAAIEGLVLLKNLNRSNHQPVLPLRHEMFRRNGDLMSPLSLAIIGPNAGCGSDSREMCDSVTNMLGPYTQYNNNVEVKTVFQAAVGSLNHDNYMVTFSRGCNIDDTKTDMIAEAVNSARQSDIAILVLGDSLHSCGEWSDRDSLDLPGAQLQLLEGVINVTHAENSKLKNLMVVLINGRPATFGPNNALLDSVDVLLVGFRPGQMGAQAIVDVLMRGVEPRGRLAQSWPQNVGQVHGASSPWLQQIRGKWIANGRSQADPDGRIYDPYVDGPSTPLFYFGYGLSYGTFKYSDPMAKMTGNREQPVEISVTVQNTGKSAGTEVVQVYIQDPIADHVRYWKRLVGFQKVFLDKGESRTVIIQLRMDDIAMYDDDMKFRIVEGTYTLRFGGHSGNDTLITQITFQ